MKQLLSLCIAVTLMACKGEPKDYVTLSGKISNPDESKTLKVFKGRGYEKMISLDDDGSFKDTLKVIAGDYNFQHGKQYGQIYLENDNVSSFTTDNNNFIDSLKFGGDDSDLNNFTVQSFLLSKKFFSPKLVASNDAEVLNKALEDYQSSYDNLKENYTEVDSTHKALMDKKIAGTISQISNFIKSKQATNSAFPAGSPSPSFEGYENHDGGTTSLSDLQGKYVYIDLWATWCAPCLKEIPSLKRVEEQYKDKNIEFVSISIDEGRGYKNDKAAAYKAWKKMVYDKNLGGIQLLADNGFKSQFVQDYRVNGIPRFILIDPKGNIVSADAPRPSSPELMKLFNKLDL
ncbi:TlpA family protein disulfide reductase [Winogradskyella rapida]|uniref:TlpA family protein disulfide reductase n=1 Tax=Winogradskyella rapida TaxID=549701 RepID=A0ABW3KMZ0_9FLAO